MTASIIMRMGIQNGKYQQYVQNHIEKIRKLTNLIKN